VTVFKHSCFYDSSINPKPKFYVMRKVSFLLTFLLFVGFTATAQMQITGTVTNETTGEPIPGVSIVVKGQTAVGTSTDMDGNYQLNVPSDAQTLVFSFVGMETQEVAINGRSEINVALVESVSELDEVIVVAYGTQKKASFTGSASTIKAENLENAPVPSFEQALQGLSAGVQVGSGSGQPGSTNQIRIRGFGSISSGNSPLFVVDGVPVASGDFGGLGTSSLNIMSTIDPADIETITVLKDAAAASLYGSRAANGVVLINTKSGKAGKTTFRVKSEYGMSDFAMENAPMVGPEKEYEFKHMGFVNAYVDAGYTESESQDLATQGMESYFPNYDPDRPDSDYDWDDALFRTGQTQNHKFSANGGNESTTFYGSLNYFKNEGVAEGSDYDRYMGRINLEHKANDVFTLGFNSSLAVIEQQTIPSSSLYYVNPMWASKGFLNRLTPIRNEDGSYNRDIVFGAYPNVVRELGLTFQDENLYRSQNKAFISANVMEGLQLKSTFGYDYIANDAERFWPPSSSDGETHNGYGSKEHNLRKYLTSSNTLTYDKTLADVHNVNFLAGYEIEAVKNETTFTDGHGYPNDQLRFLGNAAEAYSTGSTMSDRRLISYLSRLNYDYNNKYYISASFRRDGSSKLGANTRWGDFWSLSGSWRVTEEPFMQGFTWMDDMKIRASYGTNGTLPGPWYGTLALYSYGANYIGNPGSYVSQIPNPNLEWEKSKNMNIGVDLSLFNMLTIEAEYYSRRTTDLLLQVPISRTTGFSTVWQNVGEMVNKGVELTINSVNFHKGDFYWSTQLNLSHNKNTIEELYKGEDIQSFPFILREGESYNSFYLRDWAGVDPETGQGGWYVIDQIDDNDDGLIDREVRVDEDGDGEWDITRNSSAANKDIVGTSDPDLFGGITNTFRYKGFDLSFLFNFKLGGQSYYDLAYYLWNDGYRYPAGITEYQYENQWRESGDNAEFPRYVMFGSGINTHFNSDRRLNDATYVRLKNLSFGYTLPEKFTQRAGLSKVRLYVNAVNLWTWAAFDHYDPETTARGFGFANSDFPPLKTVTFGAELNF